MKIEFLKKNCEPKENLLQIYNTKIGKLDKYPNFDDVVKVVMKKEGDKCKCEISFLIGKRMVRSEAVGDNFYDVIDVVVPKIESQISKHKSKLASMLKKNAFKSSEFEKEEDLTSLVVEKTKTFKIVPMSIDEASLEMDLIGHDFYIFKNEETQKLSVLYRRDNGKLGLLQPEEE